MTLLQIKGYLRNGAYAWPGGYPIYYVTRDGGVLCPDCVRKNWSQVVYDHLHKCNTGWRVDGAGILEGDPEIEEWPSCDDCGSDFQ